VILHDEGNHVTIIISDLYIFCNYSKHTKFSVIHLNPDQAKAPSPTAVVRQVTVPAGVSRNAARSMNTV